MSPAPQAIYLTVYSREHQNLFPSGMNPKSEYAGRVLTVAKMGIWVIMTHKRYIWRASATAARFNYAIHLSRIVVAWAGTGSVTLEMCMEAGRPKFLCSPRLPHISACDGNYQNS